MTKNVGGKDKTLRIALGLVFLALGYLYGSWFYLLAVISFGTALIGWCPLNRLFGINSCEFEGKKEGAVYKCQGNCGGESHEPGNCNAEGCSHHGQPLVKK